jgi:hypothetical protein
MNKLVVEVLMLMKEYDVVYMRLPHHRVCHVRRASKYSTSSSKEVLL